LKSSSLSLSVAAIALLGVLFAANATGQAPAQAQSAPSAEQHEHQHPMPAPTNLKVLPKDLTGDQVHEIMHKWEASLGTECSTCHAADPNNIGPNGKPRLNFADDSKPDKDKARLMVKMVEDINNNYVGKIETSGAPVSCATCHRGHLEPPPFIPPPDHDHDHHEHPASAPAVAKPTGL
jgi:cytochrome c553